MLLQLVVSHGSEQRSAVYDLHLPSSVQVSPDNETGIRHSYKNYKNDFIKNASVGSKRIELFLYFLMHRNHLLLV